MPTRPADHLEPYRAALSALADTLRTIIELTDAADVADEIGYLMGDIDLLLDRMVGDPVTDHPTIEATRTSLARVKRVFAELDASHRRPGDSSLQAALAEAHEALAALLPGDDTDEPSSSASPPRTRRRRTDFWK